MRIFDLLRLAAKTLKGKWAVLPAAGITIGVFCLCFAGTALTKVQQEKAAPCELSITSGAAGLSDSTIAEITKNPDVIAVTPLLTVPATINTGDYSAELTLIGIVPDYLNGKFRIGGAFPGDSVMPYIVLNNAACKKFGSENSNDQNEAENNEPDIDWLSAEFTVSLGESEKPVISKVCGILYGEEEGQQPLAYISISCAKKLLQRDNQKADYTGAAIRVKNIGCSESVTKAIGLLGLTVSNSEEGLQKEWDIETEEAAYLIAAGVFSLLCAAVLIAARRYIFRLENKEAIQMLRWIGMKKRDIGRLFIVQMLILFMIGIFIGILVSVSLPSFLQSGQNKALIFTLPIPLTAVIISAAASVLIIVLPVLLADFRSRSKD